MADLSYNDAYRAAHDATREIRDMLGRVLQHADRLNNIQLQISNIHRSVDDTRRMAAILHSATNTSPQPSRHSAEQLTGAQLKQLLQVTQRLELRLQRMETYLHDVSEYFNALRMQQLNQQSKQAIKRKPKK